MLCCRLHFSNFGSRKFRYYQGCRTIADGSDTDWLIDVPDKEHNVSTADKTFRLPIYSDELCYVEIFKILI
jgi:hypothetical protein